jgi:RimJ/RimL family protein N-acetyltransferase
MAEIVPFNRRDLLEIQEHECLSSFFDKVGPKHFDLLENNGFSHTIVGSGKILGCAGVLPLSEHKAEAWAFIDIHSREHFIQVHRVVRQFLKEVPFKRVQGVVDLDFDAGHRWIKLLGFRREGTLRAYGINGQDCVMYARVRES